jgi:hypothetical protein
LWLDIAEYAYNPSTWEAETGRSKIPGQPEVHNEFKASLVYIMRLCLRNKNIIWNTGLNFISASKPE